MVVKNTNTRKHNYPAIICILLMLVFSGKGLFAQEFQLEGKVTDTEGRALEGVNILLHELQRSERTGQDGHFSFNQLKAGKYHIHCFLVGYKSSEQSVLLKESLTEMNIVLQRSVIELRSTVIEESMSKAVQREQSLSIDIINSDKMLRYGNNSLMNSLEQIAGINSINTGAAISKPVIRGLSGSRVVVAENGIKQEGQQWATDHGLEIDPYSVDQVEIVKGPSSLLYGSDALAGVLHIQPPPLPEKDKLKGSVQFNGNSVNDLLGISVTSALNVKDNFIRFRFSAQDFADYRVPADSFTYNNQTYPFQNQRVYNTAGKEHNFQLMTGVRRKWGFSTLSASMYKLHAGLFPASHEGPDKDLLSSGKNKRTIIPPIQQTEHFKLLSNTSLLLKNSWLEIDLGYQLNHRQEIEDPHEHGDETIESSPDEPALDLRLQTLSGNIRYHYDFSNRSRWVFGISGQRQQNISGGEEFLIPDFQTWSLGAFAYLKQEVTEKLLWNIGVRFDQGNISSKRFVKSLFDSTHTFSGFEQLSPQLYRNFGNASGSTGISWFPVSKFNLKLNLGSSFRMPNPSELTANGIHHGSFRYEKGDSALRSERGYQADLNMHYEEQNWFVTFSPYFNYFNHFIFLSPQAGESAVYKYSQTGALHYGAEFLADVHIYRALHLALSGQYVQAVNLQTGYSLPFMPPAQLRLDIAYEWGKTGNILRDMYVDFQIQTAAHQRQTAPEDPQTPGYLLLNFYAGTKFRVANNEWKLALGIRNLLDTPYLNILSPYRLMNIPEPGRNVFLSLLVPFEATW